MYKRPAREQLVVRALVVDDEDRAGGGREDDLRARPLGSSTRAAGCGAEAGGGGGALQHSHGCGRAREVWLGECEDLLGRKRLEDARPERRGDEHRALLERLAPEHRLLVTGIEERKAGGACAVEAPQHDAAALEDASDLRGCGPVQHAHSAVVPLPRTKRLTGAAEDSHVRSQCRTVAGKQCDWAACVLNGAGARIEGAIEIPAHLA